MALMLQLEYSEEDQKLKDAVVDVGRQFGKCLMRTYYIGRTTSNNVIAENNRLAIDAWADLAGMICDVIYEFGGDE